MAASATPGAAEEPATISEVESGPDLRRSPTARLDRILELVDDPRAGAPLPADACEDARALALALLRAADGDGAMLDAAATAYAAELLAAIAVDLAAHPARTDRLIEQLQTEAGLSRVGLGRELLRNARLLELGIEVGREVQLTLLRVLTGARATSMWTLGNDGIPTAVAHSGDLDPDAPMTVSDVRRTMGAEERMPVAVGPALGIRIAGARAADAALLAHDVGHYPAEPGPLLLAAAPLLATLLDREALDGDQVSRDSISGAVQRRLARLRYDLHDGPQQDVHLLAQDLRLFRDQLRPMIAADPDRSRVLGRLDDLEAQMVALDGDLRRLSTSVQSPFLAEGSLADALVELTAAFAGRTGITPETDFSGDLTQLSDSQQIALLALVREALSNIRKHSDASHVAISVAGRATGVEVRITDDGTGFDPDASLVRAARAGHLGLVGMHERVRMLGGRTQIESRPGGPTLISATLPPWPEGHAAA